MHSNEINIDLPKKKTKLDNLKSEYFIKNLFNILPEYKKLFIVKDNKRIQKLLGLDIDKYKEYKKWADWAYYSSPIEIEIKVVDKYKSGQFINIFEKDDKPYYHIYFNNNMEEQQHTYLQEYPNLETKDLKIKIIIDKEIKSFFKLFYMCECIESINFIKFYRRDINNMSNMFCYCSSLKELNMLNFHTNNVEDMSYMFFGCTCLKKLNLFNFITDKVNDMSSMFKRCLSLTELNISKFDTNNVTNMNDMFSQCVNLELPRMDLSHFKIKDNILTFSMFFDCPDKLKNEIKKYYKNINYKVFE